MAYKESKNKQPDKSQQYLVTGDWLYLTQNDIMVRDIKAALDITAEYKVEIWEMANTLEVELPGGQSVDIEAATINPKDEITAEYARKNGAKSVFTVAFMPENYKMAEKMMKTIIEKIGGFFCGDTDDFQPEIR